MAEDLILDWSLGLLKAAQVGRYAAKCAADIARTGHTNLEIQALGRINDGGEQNSARNLRVLYNLDDSPLGEPYTFKVPFWNAKLVFFRRAL